MSLKALRVLLPALCALGALTAFGPRAAQAQNQMQMNRSAAAEAHRAEEAMNRACRKLRSVLTAPQKRQLTTAQTAWLKFRDAENLWLSSKVEGGSVYPTVYSLHRAEITRERTRELTRAYQLMTTEGDM